MTKYIIDYLLFAFCFLILCGLGVWQLFRREAKESLINKINQNMYSPAVLIPENVYKSNEYSHVILHGKFLPDKDIYVYDPRVRDGRTGFTLLSAFMLQDKRIILVDRGFVFEEMKGTKFTAERVFDAIIIFPKQPSYFSPENRPEKYEWFSIDTKAMGRFLDLKLENFYVKMSKKSGEFPIVEQYVPNIPNNHLQYSLTWFTLAAIFIAIFWSSI